MMISALLQTLADVSWFHYQESGKNIRFRDKVYIVWGSSHIGYYLAMLICGK